MCTSNCSPPHSWPQTAALNGCDSHTWCLLATTINQAPPPISNLNSKTCRAYNFNLWFHRMPLISEMSECVCSLGCLSGWSSKFSVRTLELDGLSTVSGNQRSAWLITRCSFNPGIGALTGSARSCDLLEKTDSWVKEPDCGNKIHISSSTQLGVVQSAPAAAAVDEVATRCSEVELRRQPRRGETNTIIYVFRSLLLQTVGLISALHLCDLAFREFLMSRFLASLSRFVYLFPPHSAPRMAPPLPATVWIHNDDYKSSRGLAEFTSDSTCVIIFSFLMFDSWKIFLSLSLSLSPPSKNWSTLYTLEHSRCA